VSEKQVVGIAKVTREARADPTASEGDWSCVTLAPLKPLVKPVTLEQIKSDSLLKDLPLLRQSRLSVVPVKPAEFKEVLRLGETRA
jgi:predicted RNA-binding protein with PUA-like domain